MKVKFNQDSAMKAAVLVLSGIIGAAVSNGIYAVVPGQYKKPVTKFGLAATMVVGASAVQGDDYLANAARGFLVGGALTQGHEAVVAPIREKVSTTNKFVAGMLNGATEYTPLPEYTPQRQAQPQQQRVSQFAFQDV